MFGRESTFNPEEFKAAEADIKNPRSLPEELSGQDSEKYQANIYNSWQEAAELLLKTPLSQRAISELQASGKTALAAGENPHLKVKEGLCIELQQQPLQDLANIVTRVTLQAVNREDGEDREEVDFVYLLSNAENGKTTNLAQFLDRDINIVTTYAESILKFREDSGKRQYFAQFIFGRKFDYGIPMQAMILVSKTDTAGDLVALIHEIGHALDYQHADAERRASMDIAGQMYLREHDRTASSFDITQSHISIERAAWANALKLIRRLEQQSIITDSSFILNTITLMNESLEAYADHVMKTQQRSALYTSEMRARNRRMESKIWHEIDHQADQEKT